MKLSIIILIPLFLVACNKKVTNFIPQETQTVSKDTVSVIDDLFKNIKASTDTIPSETETASVPKTTYIAIVDFDSVYEYAPALKRLRASLDSYKPAQELMKLGPSDTTARARLLKQQVKMKMKSIIYECKISIHKAIEKEWPSHYQAIADVKGKLFVRDSTKVIEYPLVQDKITGRLIELLQ